MNQNSSLITIRTSSLKGNREVSFDVYVPVGDKNVLYIRKDNPFEAERLDRLTSKKVRKLLIPADQEGQYKDYLNNNINKMFDKSLALEKKANIAVGMAESSLEELGENPRDVKALGYTSTLMSNIADFLTSEPLALGKALGMSGFDQDMYSHSVRVATLAAGFLEKIGTSKEITNQVMLGALLHDIGKSKLMFDASKSIEELPETEQQLLKQHPQLGFELMSQNNECSKKTLAIIQQHEEKRDGSGYPQKLQKNNIDPHAEMIALINVFDKMVSFKKMSIKDACKELTINYVGLFDLNHIQLIREILKAQEMLK